MPNKNLPDVGWLFGKLYICETDEQLRKVADIGNICRNTKYKTFYHKFLLRKYEKIKHNQNYQREPFANFEKDISRYAYQTYIRSSIDKHKSQDTAFTNYIQSLAEKQYQNS